MLVYLDNSATSFPKPENVRKTVANAMTKFSANTGRSAYAMAQATTNAVYETRKKISQFFNANGAEKVVFTKNCTESINTVIQGYLKPGDHVVISDLEHNAVLRPIYALAEKGVEYSIFKTYVGEPEKTIDSLRSCLKHNTKLMVCTVASNVFGIRLPFGRLCALCHMYDIATCVDAAQGAGVVPINMEKDMIDFLCVPSHKSLYGIMGAGVLVCQKDLRPLTFGGTGTSSFDFGMPKEFPEKLESGTLPVPAILSIGSGIDFVNKIGMEKIHQAEIRKIAYLYQELEKMDKVILYTEKPNAKDFVPVLSFNIKGKTAEEVGEILAKKGIAVRCGVHCAPLAHNKMQTLDGTVRVSVSVFSTENDIKTLIMTIKNL